MTYIADEYARVLNELGISYELYKDVADKLDMCPELLSALDDPTISSHQKHRVIDALFDKDIVSFVKCLCDNRRISFYKDILSAYRTILDNEKGILEADFTAAFIPEDGELDKIKSMLMKKYDKKGVSLTVKEDKSLLGGFVLRVGDTEYDKSLKGIINNMKRKLEWR